MLPTNWTDETAVLTAGACSVLVVSAFALYGWRLSKRMAVRRILKLTTVPQKNAVGGEPKDVKDEKRE
jgi:hypothetical protein